MQGLWTSDSALAQPDSHSSILQLLSVVPQQMLPHDHTRGPRLSPTTCAHILVIAQRTRELAVKGDVCVAFNFEDGEGREILADGGHGVQRRGRRGADDERHLVQSLNNSESR